MRWPAIVCAFAVGIASTAAAQTPAPKLPVTQTPTTPTVFGPSPKGGPGGGFRTGLGRDIDKLLRIERLEMQFERVGRDVRIEARAEGRAMKEAPNK